MIRKRKRLWAMLLSAALIVTQLPAVAMAENDAPEDGSIASFEELPSGVKKQTVTVGTSLSELNLPDTVTATVYRVTEDTVIPDKVNGGEADREGGLGREDGSEDESGDSSAATPSDAKESVSGNSSKDSSIKDSGETVTTVTTSTEQIPVTWDSEPAYDGDTEGKYLFTADADGHILSSGALPPQISVEVTAGTVNLLLGTEPPSGGSEKIFTDKEAFLNALNGNEFQPGDRITARFASDTHTGTEIPGDLSKITLIWDVNGDTPWRFTNALGTMLVKQGVISVSATMDTLIIEGGIVRLGNDSVIKNTTMTGGRLAASTITGRFVYRGGEKPPENLVLSASGVLLNESSQPLRGITTSAHPGSPFDLLPGGMVDGAGNLSYPITILDSPGGTVKSGSALAKKGDTVTITAEPDSLQTFRVFHRSRRTTG